MTSPAPPADVEKKDETVSPPAVEEKRQPVVASSYVSSHSPVTRIVPPVNPPANNPTPPKPTPDRTEEEDIDYDSDDASTTEFFL